jgi:hypothetical protein
VPWYAKIVIGVVGFFTVVALIGAISGPPPATPPSNGAATASDDGDPCFASIPSWLRPSNLPSVEQCRRLQAIQYQLKLEEEYARNPNFKPYSTTPNRR